MAEQDRYFDRSHFVRVQRTQVRSRVNEQHETLGIPKHTAYVRRTLSQVVCHRHVGAHFREGAESSQMPIRASDDNRRAPASVC